MSLISSLSLLLSGAIIIGAGLLRLDRQDRRRLDSNRQDACRWHQWQVHEEDAPPVCALCGRRSGAAPGLPDPARDNMSSGHTFFP